MGPVSGLVTGRTPLLAEPWDGGVGTGPLISSFGVSWLRAADAAAALSVIAGDASRASAAPRALSGGGGAGSRLSLGRARLVLGALADAGVGPALGLARAVLHSRELGVPRAVAGVRAAGGAGLFGLKLPASAFM